MVLSKLLAAYRREKKLGLRELASRIGCIHTTIWRLEKGYPCDDKNLVKILIWLLEDNELGEDAKKKAKRRLADLKEQIVSPTHGGGMISPHP